MWKKIICSCLIFIIIASVNIGFAETSDKVAALYDLKLMKGNGEGFDLYSKLKRSEASTFIVKLMGLEDDVMDQPTKYIETPFSDVNTTDWFAPFVGYCYQNGIVKGFEDGTFRPDDYVSEKAFLTMVLGALDYEADSDFNWNTVLQKSYEVGLVDDIQYAVRTDDNMNYLREDVVHAIYSSLTKPINGDRKTVVERLIDRNVTNKVVAKKYDLLIEDELETELESVQVVDETTIQVRFNETLSRITNDQVKILFSDEEIAVSSIVQDENSIMVQVSTPLYEVGEYKIKFVNIRDQLGFTVKETFEKTFKGIQRPRIESDEFEVAYIDPISRKLFEVFFTQPINEDAEQALMYKFGMSGAMLEEGNFKSLEVTRNTLNEKSVFVELLNREMLPNVEYDLFVRGDLQSAYKMNVKDGEGVKYTFAAIDRVFEDLKVDSVEVIDSYYIQIEFNQDVDVESALKTSNYKITNLMTGSDVKPYNLHFYREEDGLYKDRVMVRVPALKENVDYRVEITDVKDTYKQSVINHFQDEFTGEESEKQLPEIYDTEALNKTTVKVEFSEPLGLDSIQGRIDISNDVDVEAIRIDENIPTLMYVYLSKEKPLKEDKEYVLTVKSGVEDYLGRSVKGGEDDEFEGVDDVRDSIYIEEAKYISGNRVWVKFSDLIYKKDIEDVDKYEFEYSSGSVKKLFYASGIQVVSQDTVILELDVNFVDGEIVLDLEEMKDYSGEYKYSNLSKTLKR